jgi:acyl carrier protein
VNLILTFAIYFCHLLKQKRQERFPMIDVSPVKSFIINNFLFGDGSKLTTDTISFLDSGIVDSTGILELITFLEQEYEITITDDEMLPENLDSLVHIQAFVGRKKT